MHLSSVLFATVQVSGEAMYVDDMPLPSNALHAAFVFSTRPHAKLLSVDSSAASTVTPYLIPELFNAPVHFE